MNKELTIFDNPNFGEIRVVNINGEPYFVAKDVAEALGYAKPRNAIARYVDEDDALKWGVIDALGRLQETTVINESGMYSLVLSSTLPSAREFKKWVTSEVLPSIRQTGSYATGVPQIEPISAASLGGMARFIGVQRSIMKDRKCTADEVAI